MTPKRCSDGPSEAPVVKLWQLCSYARGKFPPLHPLLSGPSTNLWRSAPWCPPSAGNHKQKRAPN
eukprot:5021175-Amphidinium_carterae.1